MPKLSNMTLDEVNKTTHGFQYTSVGFEKLGAMEYTIVQMIADQSGSVVAFQKDLEAMLSTCVQACKSSPRSENLLYRTTTFNSVSMNANIKEVHGFSLLNSIDTNVYRNAIRPDGGTPLWDAVLDGVEAVFDYSKSLHKQKFMVNGILFILTDGEENDSAKCDNPREIKKVIDRIRSEKIMDSFRTILIGVNDSDKSLRAKLDAFKTEAGIDEYISIGDATPSKLAKLGQFVSQSISSQSQSLMGLPSKPITLTF